MKTILSLILLSLFVCTAYTAAETLTLTQVGSNLGKDSVLIFKCAGSANFAAGDGVTHAF